MAVKVSKISRYALGNTTTRIRQIFKHTMLIHLVVWMFNFSRVKNYTHIAKSPGPPSNIKNPKFVYDEKFMTANI